MFFLAFLAMTFAAFSGIGFTNPDPAWVRVSKDDWGSDLAVVVMRSEGGDPQLELKRAVALMEKPMVPVDGRYVLPWREVGWAARMHYRGFARGYGLDQRRRREEPGAAGARTWRRA